MLKPLGDRVVLKIEEKEQTVGGFVLAGSAQEKNTSKMKEMFLKDHFRIINFRLKSSTTFWRLIRPR